MTEMYVTCPYVLYSKVPILGKHTKKILCGEWSSQNLLALGSDDKTISISNAEGDTLRQTNVRSEPNDIQFSEMKSDQRSNVGENTVSDMSSDTSSDTSCAGLVYEMT